MKRTLITGANGFIGTALMEAYEDAGYSVMGWGKQESTDNNISFVNMADYNEVYDGLSRILPDIIVHCAGSASVFSSILEPKKDFSNSVHITHNLIFSILKLGIKPTVLFLSSAGVYGNPGNLPIAESAAVNPISPYALHKHLCEQICEYAKRNHAVDVRILRIFSAYGRGLRKQIFWDMYQKYMDNGKIILAGTGRETRDFIHIRDLVQAVILIGNHKENTGIINVANGTEVKIADAAYCFAKCAGADKDCVSFSGRNRSGDPLCWSADITRLKQIGYCQTVSLEEGLMDYVKWLKERES